MVLRVDLGCDKCRRKIKKLLCRYPGESLRYVFGDFVIV